MGSHSDNGCLASLVAPRGCVWSIPALHGHAGRLAILHDALFEQIRPGDRIVYHGNYGGHGPESGACIDELLTFRRMVLSIPGMLCSDIVYLRGQQEEIWQKLLQLQFCPNPIDTYLWMLSHGLSATLQSYGFSHHDGLEACRSGVMGITKWTTSLREARRARPGHEAFANQLKRAAATHDGEEYPMLFVHAGLKADRPIHEQGDSFWWASGAFETMGSAYLPYQKVVRGYDPAHKGMNLNCITATIDDACGFGGPLVGVAFAQDGNVLEILES